MTLDIDTSRAIRTNDQLVALVRAVEKAMPEDESRAVEWKSGYEDLTSAEASFAIARAILGLANRPVDVSRATFEGVGYVLVGVEPGSVKGQLVPDSAELLNALRRFTGHGWPLWDSRSVTVDDTGVLVVTVEPPRSGDRMALLHKSYQPVRGALVEEGTVFVRQSGATERASRADLNMLQDRLLNGTEADAEAVRTAEREQLMRGLVADMVHAANRWVSSMEILIIMSAGGAWSQREWIEFIETDTGREMATNAQLISQNARKLRLLTNESTLLGAVSEAVTMLNDANAFKGVHGDTGERTDGSRTKAYAQIYATKRAFLVVESAAIKLLSK